MFAGSSCTGKHNARRVLSITPRLLRSIRRPDLMTAEFNSGTEASVGGRASVGGTPEAIAAPEQAAPRSGSPMTGGDEAPAADKTSKGGQ